MNLEEQGKEFAENLCNTLANTGLTTQLNDPGDAFESGCYFGTVQGYKRGVNQMLQFAIESLPDIFNKIAETNFDMTINWKEEYKKLLLSTYFDIKDI